MSVRSARFTAHVLAVALAACGGEADPGEPPAPPAIEVPPAGDAEIGGVAGRFATAVETGDAAGARALSTEAFWLAGRDSGRRFLEQAVRKRLTLIPEDEGRRSRGRAVLGAAVATGGRVVDRVLLYLVRVDGAWRIDGLDETGARVGPFLAGRLDPRFHPADLPPDPRIEAAADRLIEPGDRFVGSRWSAALGRGALVVETRAGSRAQVVVEPAPGGAWRVLGRSDDLGVGGFLEPGR